MECKHCKNTFKNKSILQNHIRTAKYCIKIQKKLGLKIDTVCYLCEYCPKTFTQKIDLQRHEASSCFSKHRFKLIQQKEIMYKSQINELRKQQEKYENHVKELQARLENIAIKAVSCPISFQDNVIEIEEEPEDDEIVNDSMSPLKVGNSYNIEHREDDGYINVTNLCKAGKKQFKHWNSLQKTKSFLRVLSESVGIPTDSLIKYNYAYGKERATWVHPQIAINIAQWISPQFDVKVSAWIYEVMMTGKVDITNTKSYRQLQHENKKQQLKIRYLTKKYVKRQSRVEYKERHVIYILTTSSHKKKGIYILGKATNLTARLSTYNKTDEHEVIYYQQCKDEESLSIVEILVFSKLKEYRQQANRERFILPRDEKISVFIEVIKECVEFCGKRHVRVSGP